MLYINITFDQNDGKGERTFTLAMKPKPWTTAEGAWFVEHEINAKNESDVVRDPLSIKNTKVNDIAPLSPYRVYGGVIKGLEETSSVAIINRASGLNGLLQISPVERYYIKKIVRESPHQHGEDKMMIMKPEANIIDPDEMSYSNSTYDNDDDYMDEIEDPFDSGYNMSDKSYYDDEDYDIEDDLEFDDGDSIWGQQKKRKRRSTLHDTLGPLTEESFMDYEFIRITANDDGDVVVEEDPAYKYNFGSSYTLEGDDAIDLGEVESKTPPDVDYIDDELPTAHAYGGRDFARGHGVGRKN